MKRIRLIAGVCASAAALSLVLAGCSGAGNNSSESKSDTTKTDTKNADMNAVITAWGSEPQNPLVPGNTNETGGGTVVDTLWEGLVYYDNKGKIHNGVADSIKPSDDNKTWTITIKTDRKFSDGTPVKAQNFVKAWKSVTQGSQLNASWFSNFVGTDDNGSGNLSGTTAVDDKTIKITLKTPDATLPIQLGYSAFYPLADASFDGDKLKADFGKNGNVVGNGPYKFVDWKNNQYIKVVKNPNYVGDRQAKNGGVTFKIYTQDTAAYADLQSGTLDVMQTVPVASRKSFKKDLGDRAIQQEQAVWQGFSIGAKVPHFDISTEEGKLRRQAISMAIDRKTITDKIFNNTVVPAKAWFNKTIPFYNDKVEGADVLSFNPDKARELWEKADKISKFSGEFTLAYNADASHKEWVDAVCNSIKTVLKIPAHGDGVPTFKDFRDKVTKHEIKGGFRSGWQADYPSATNYYSPQYVTGGSSNDAQYSSKQFDAIVKKMYTTTDKSEQQKLSDQASSILFKDMPSIPLWTSQATGGHSERTSNVSFDWHGVPVYYQVVVNKK